MFIHLRKGDKSFTLPEEIWKSFTLPTMFLYKQVALYFHVTESECNCWLPRAVREAERASAAEGRKDSDSSETASSTIPHEEVWGVAQN